MARINADEYCLCVRYGSNFRLIFIVSIYANVLGLFHQKMYTWCLGLVWYIITIKKMFSKQIRPTDANPENKLGLNTIRWSNDATVLPTLCHEDEVAHYF